MFYGERTIRKAVSASSPILDTAMITTFKLPDAQTCRLHLMMSFSFHTPLFLDTSADVKLWLMRTAPPFKNIPQISYLGNVKIFDFNSDSTQATLWERFYSDQGLNQYSRFLPELFCASRILFQSKYGHIRPESIPSIIWEHVWTCCTKSFDGDGYVGPLAPDGWWLGYHISGQSILEILVFLHSFIFAFILLFHPFDVLYKQ